MVMSTFLCAVWMPPAQDQSVYDQLFHIADESRSGEITGSIAVAFFGRSGLAKPVLREVCVQY